MQTLRVLIAEDDAMIGLSLAELVVGFGHGVCATATPEAGAVTAAILYRPDLMIVDGRLCEGSGVSAVEEILRARPVVHAFVSVAPAEIKACRPAAVILRKPFRAAELVRAIELALDAVAAS